MNTLAGNSASWSASSLVITFGLSKRIQLGRAGSEPVAMMIFSASRISSPPSLSATATLLRPASRPVPASTSTFARLSRKATPLLSFFTTASLLAIMAAKSRETSLTLMPMASAWRMLAKTSAEWHSALVGMQPRFRHTPPSVSLSTTAVVLPSCAALSAAT